MLHSKLGVDTRSWLIAILLLLSVALRLYGITNPVYDWNFWRQSETAALAMNYYEDSLPFLYPEIDWIGPNGHAEMEFPLYPYLISWIYFLTWPSDIWGRIITIFCAVGAVWAMWDIGRRIRNRQAGFFAAAFFSFSPLTIYFGRSFQPDMMMVFLSTLSISFLLRWTAKRESYWFFFASIALMTGVLLKPPCFIVAFPIFWILWSQDGFRVYRNPWIWLSLGIIFVPTFLWYWRANHFFQESGATFMWHFKHFSIEKNLLSVYRDPVYWQMITLRIYDNVLAYVGMIPLTLGLIRCLFRMDNRGFVWMWLAGMAALYLIVGAHHIGHDYYSLLAAPPLAMTCAVGCEWIQEWFKKRWHWLAATAYILPLAMLVSSSYMLISRGWFTQLYQYYDDAKALREYVPKDSLILVMDELYHTPEFFYFINRVGWHRFRDPRDGAEDSEWVETHRAKGAEYYFGLNEFGGNHPMLYLQDHIQGQYLSDHYVIQKIGFRYFMARLDQPIYGDHLYKHYKKMITAIPNSLAKTVASYIDRTTTLEEWKQADAIVIDFHKAQEQEWKTIRSTYEEAVNNGFVITRQQGGRIVLEKSDRINPVPEFMAHVDRIIPSSNSEKIDLGYFEPGRYRFSFHFESFDPDQPIEIRIETNEGSIVSRRILHPYLLNHMLEGDNPECHVHIETPNLLYAYAESNGIAIKPMSVISMPDVQCIGEDAVIQTESIFTNQASVMTDDSAERQSALWSKADEDGHYMFFGPFFEFPPGIYDFTFRLRSAATPLQGDLELIVSAPDQVFDRLELKPPGGLPPVYTPYTLHADLQKKTPIDLRIFLHPGAAVYTDTIQIHHRARQINILNKQADLALLFIKGPIPQNQSKRGINFTRRRYD